MDQVFPIGYREIALRRRPVPLQGRPKGWPSECDDEKDAERDGQPYEYVAVDPFRRESSKYSLRCLG